VWLNSAFSALIGIMLTTSPFAACVLLVVLVIHLFIKKTLAHIFFYLVIIIVFFIICTFRTPILSEFNWEDDKIGDYAGRVIFDDQLNLDGEVLTGAMNASGEQLQFNYYIGSEQEQILIKKRMPYFSSCPVQMSIHRPLPNTNGLKFNYDEYLANQGLRYTAQVKALSLTECQPVQLNFIDSIKWYRVTLVDRMMELPFDKMSYVVALTLGDTRYLSHNELAELKTLGIYHLYAISGSHVALLTVQLLFVFKRLYLPLIYSTGAIIALLPVYALLTGFSPSVLRASLFIALYMMLKRWGMTLLDSLALSFIIFLLYDIHLINDIGFQLSYMISFVLVFTDRLFDKKSPLVIFLMTTFIAQLSSFPVILLHFNTIQWSGLITNLLFVPFFNILMFPACTLLLLMTMIFNAHPPVVFNMLSILFTINDHLVAFFSALNMGETVIANQQGICYIIVAAFFYYAVAIGYRSVVKSMAAMLIYCLLIVGWSQLQVPHDSITFVDVGQGDSTIIESKRHVMVIDTGGKMQFDDAPWKQRRKQSTIAEFSIIPMLTERGYQQIDYLLLTHPDQDHFGEAVELLQRFDVKNLILNPEAAGAEKYKETIAVAEKRQTRVIDVRRLTSLTVGNAQVSVMNSDYQSAEENDSSVITTVKLGQRRYLLMADLPIAREESVMQLCRSIDVLKVGHHGSDTSTSDALLDCIQPQLAVISAGRNNRFGHPHESVIQRLQQRHIQVMSTQQQGKIEIVDDVLQTGKTALKKARQ